MPRFHLHQRGGVRDFTDEDGQDLPGLTAAHQHAIDGIRSILADEILHGRLPLGERIDIEDEAGRVLLSVDFAESFRLEPSSA
ncbi:MAG TPA: hypothetical protein VF589_09825 [Allosphingosinicella sp.]|jgi:hypothetical protein